MTNTDRSQRSNSDPTADLLCPSCDEMDGNRLCDGAPDCTCDCHGPPGVANPAN